MAQNIALVGAEFPDVPSIILPKVGGGTASFVDITDTTATAPRVRKGDLFFLSDGTPAIGTYSPYLEPIVYDYLKGYVMNGKWIYQDSENNHTDIYPVEINKNYYLFLGSTVGTRFRAVVISENPYGTTEDYTGTIIVNTSNPSPYAGAAFKASIDGFLCITKDNVGTAGLKSYLIDLWSLVE